MSKTAEEKVRRGHELADVLQAYRDVDKADQKLVMGKYGEIQTFLVDLIEQARQEERSKLLKGRNGRAEDIAKELTRALDVPRKLKVIGWLVEEIKLIRASAVWDEHIKWEEKIRARVKEWEEKKYTTVGLNSTMVKELESLLPPKEREQPEYHGVNSMKGEPPKAEK